MSHTKQRLVRALAALCAREGVTNVANTIGSSQPTLSQIIHGTLTKSGKPRGIGVRLQARLDEHYPGWDNNELHSAIDTDTVHVQPLHTTQYKGKFGIHDEQLDFGGDNKIAPANIVFTDALPISFRWLREHVAPTSINALRYMYANRSRIEGLEDGDIMLVDTAQRDAGMIQDGIYLFHFFKFYVDVRRLRRNYDGAVEIISESQTPKVLTLDDVKTFELLGRIIYIWRGYKA